MKRKDCFSSANTQKPQPRYPSPFDISRSRPPHHHKSITISLFSKNKLMNSHAFSTDVGTSSFHSFSGWCCMHRLHPSHTESVRESSRARMTSPPPLLPPPPADVTAENQFAVEQSGGKARARQRWRRRRQVTSLLFIVSLMCIYYK